MQFSDPDKSLPTLLNQDTISEGLRCSTANEMTKCSSGGNYPNYMLLCKMRLSHSTIEYSEIPISNH
jgi:hypothetical protein